MVTLYSTPQCAPCKIAARQFEANSIEYKKVDLTAEPDTLAALKEKRGSDVIQTPLMEYGGEFYNMTGLRDLIASAKGAVAA